MPKVNDRANASTDTRTLLLNKKTVKAALSPALAIARVPVRSACSSRATRSRGDSINCSAGRNVGAKSGLANVAKKPSSVPMISVAALAANGFRSERIAAGK